MSPKSWPFFSDWKIETGDKAASSLQSQGNSETSKSVARCEGIIWIRGQKNCPTKTIFQ